MAVIGKSVGRHLSFPAPGPLFSREESDVPLLSVAGQFGIRGRCLASDLPVVRRADFGGLSALRFHHVLRVPALGALGRTVEP